MNDLSLLLVLLIPSVLQLLLLIHINRHKTETDMRIERVDMAFSMTGSFYDVGSLSARDVQLWRLRMHEALRQRHSMLGVPTLKKLQEDHELRIERIKSLDRTYQYTREDCQFLGIPYWKDDPKNSDLHLITD